MTTLLKKIENTFHNDKSETGSLMGPRLYFDFHVLEAVVRFLRDEPSHKTVEDAKTVFDQFVHEYVSDWKDLNGVPLDDDLNKCFYAWWKDTPDPQTLEQQDKRILLDEKYQALQSFEKVAYYNEEPRQRVRRKLDQIELDEQMYGHNDIPEGMGSPFKASNPWLEGKLQGTAKDMRIAFLTNFKGVTEMQIPDMLENKGVFLDDKSKRNRLAKYLITRVFNNSNSITELTGGELPLKRPEVLEWAIKQVKSRGYQRIYMKDSRKWYTLRDNKYTSDTCPNEEDSLKSILNDYYDLSNKWSQEYPSISYYIDKVTDHLQNDHYLETDIGEGLNLTESEFNNKVLEEGTLCTPHGLYDYTNKISDSNGFTKVTTKAKICDMTDQEINTCRGVQLFSDFMQQIQPDQETRNYLVGVIANAITGHRENEYTYIFHGSTGANGKSVLTGLLKDMLGDYCETYDTDSLVRGSKGNPKEAAKMLEGRRLVIGSEIGDGSTIDGGAFKRYFSNDSYTIRDIYKPAYTVKPTHTMFLPVNQMPNFGSDPAVRRRLVVIPFTEHFVTNPDPRNPHEHQLKPDTLKNLIAHEDEIFTYLVRYAEQLRKGNITLTVPATIQHYGDDMVNKSNIIADFIDREVTYVLTEEEMNDRNIPTPAYTRAELYDRFIASLAPGSYNSYKTGALFSDALMAMIHQLKYDNAARGTDGKQHYAIRGILLNPNTTAAIKVLNSRHDNDLNASISYITFRSTLKCQEWYDKKIEEEQRKIKQLSSCNDPVNMHIEISSEF